MHSKHLKLLVFRKSPGNNPKNGNAEKYPRDGGPRQPNGGLQNVVYREAKRNQHSPEFLDYRVCGGTVGSGRPVQCICKHCGDFVLEWSTKRFPRANGVSRRQNIMWYKGWAKSKAILVGLLSLPPTVLRADRRVLEDYFPFGEAPYPLPQRSTVWQFAPCWRGLLLNFPFTSHKKGVGTNLKEPRATDIFLARCS